jgi:hypothetical protein
MKIKSKLETLSRQGASLYSMGVGPIADFFEGSGKVVGLVAITDCSDGREKYRIYPEGHLFVG